MQPARRSFLFAARLPPSDAWGRFCGRLARSAHGLVEDLTPAPGQPGRARLRAARAADVHHARALCEAFSVMLVPVGTPEAVLPASLPWLWVDPVRLTQIAVLAPGRVAAEPGALVHAVREAGGAGLCPGAAAEMTVGQWLNDSACAGRATGGVATAGVLEVDVLLADGTLEPFGPFGADSRRPALSKAVSRLVSALFTCAAADPAAGWRTRAYWPARYRLDALFAVSPNLAHVLLGSGGTLAWVERAVLQAAPVRVDGRVLDDGLRDEAVAAEAAWLDAKVKGIFDPKGMFPVVGGR